MTRRPAIGIIIPLPHQGTERSAPLQWDHAAVQAISAAGGKIHLFPFLLCGSEQEMLDLLTELLEEVDGLLLHGDQTPVLSAKRAQDQQIAWWSQHAYHLARKLGVPLLGIGAGACQLALASGGTIHPQERAEGNQTRRVAPTASGEVVMMDRSYWAHCMPESFAPLLRAEGDVLAVESPLQGRVKRLAAPFTPWAWSCGDASIVAFGTHLGETGSYAVGTCLPIQSEHLRPTLISRLLFGSFVAAACERRKRRREAEDFFGHRSEAPWPRWLSPASSPIRSLAPQAQMRAGGVRGA